MPYECPHFFVFSHSIFFVSFLFSFVTPHYFVTPYLPSCSACLYAGKEGRDDSFSYFFAKSFHIFLFVIELCGACKNTVRVVNPSNFSAHETARCHATRGLLSLVALTKCEYEAERIFFVRNVKGACVFPWNERCDLASYVEDVAMYKGK